MTQARTNGHGTGSRTTALKREATTVADLNRKRMLASLMNRKPRESMESVAKRAGVSRSTLYRAMQDPNFVDELNKQIDAELLAARSTIMRSVARKADKGDMAAARLYLEKSGDLKLRLSIEHQPVERIDTVPLTVRRLFIYLVDNPHVEWPRDLDIQLQSFMGDVVLSLPPAAYRVLDSPTGSGNGAAAGDSDYL